MPGVADAATAYSRALIYPGATAFAYINEIELRQIRARSRVFAQTNPYAIGAARNRVAYAVGSGHTYNVLPRDADAAGEAMLDDCRKVLEDFRKRNQWSKRQKETVRRLDRDGERFLRLFVDETRGELNVRFVEPLEIQNPPEQDRRPTASTSASSSARVGDGGRHRNAGELLPREHRHAGRIDRPARNGAGPRRCSTSRPTSILTWPRGLPTWYRLAGPLERRRADAEGHGQDRRVPRRIGMIRRHINATKHSMQTSREPESPPKTATARTATAAESRTASQYPYAAIIDTSDATRVPVSPRDGPGRQERGGDPGRVAGLPRRPWPCRSTCFPAMPPTRTFPARWWPKARP